MKNCFTIYARDCIRCFYLGLNYFHNNLYFRYYDLCFQDESADSKYSKLLSSSKGFTRSNVLKSILSIEVILFIYPNIVNANFLINQGHNIHTEYNFTPHCFCIKSEEYNMLLFSRLSFQPLKWKKLSC